MPNPHSFPSPWLISLIIITTLSGVIIGVLSGCLIYFITFRKNRSIHNITARQDGQITQLTPENIEANPRTEVEPQRAYLGVDKGRRIPFLTLNQNFVESVYPSVHKSSPSGSILLVKSSHQDRAMMAFADGHKIPPVGIKTLTEKPDCNESQAETRISHKSSSAKSGQNVSSKAPVIIQLLPSLVENKHELQSFRGFPREEIETSFCSTGYSNGFDLSIANEHAIQSVENLPELPVLPSAIVETTEKKRATQVLRKRLLSLVFSPKNQRFRNLLEEKEVKYYWEMMQLESNDTWWQLPFPPQFSPFNTNFETAESEI